jgi:hypothetical protein
MAYFHFPFPDRFVHFQFGKRRIRPKQRVPTQFLLALDFWQNHFFSALSNGCEEAPHRSEKLAVEVFASDFCCR